MFEDRGSILRVWERALRQLIGDSIGSHDVSKYIIARGRKLKPAKRQFPD
jgi:hypothetical protein